MRTDNRLDRRNRTVIYPDVTVQICVGEHSITPATAKSLLGWETHEAYRDRLEQTGLTGKRREPPISLWDVQDRAVTCWNMEGLLNTTKLWGVTYSLLYHNPPSVPIIVMVGPTGLVIQGKYYLAALVLAEEVAIKESDRSKDLSLDAFAICGVRRKGT